MKLIKAYLHTYYAYEIVQALEKEGISLISAIDINMLGRDTDPEQREISSELGIHTPMIKLEFISTDDRADSIISIIRSMARTGDQGMVSDGCIVKSAIDEVTPIARKKNE